MCENQFIKFFHFHIKYMLCIFYIHAYIDYNENFCIDTLYNFSRFLKLQLENFNVCILVTILIELLIENLKFNFELKDF